MKRTEYLIKLIDEFDKWYASDEHSKNINYYQNTINESYLKSLNNKGLIDFFCTFVEVGGKVQSGGHRNKTEFLETVTNKTIGFKEMILKPFIKDFNELAWLKQIDKFSGFGFGIATIYLNRVNKSLYPILNDKTLQALRSLGFNISKTKNISNYEKVKKYQLNLIREYPVLQDFYKTDALNHFLVAIYQGQTLLEGMHQIDLHEDELEQLEIESNLNLEKINQSNLQQLINNCQNENEEYIYIKGKRVKRNNYLMVLIKRYRGYSCQFCTTTILKKNGSYYIEACHILPKSQGGKDKLDNILVLCPNCHKLFDYGNRKNDNFNDNGYSVCLNEVIYNAILN